MEISDQDAENIRQTREVFYCLRGLVQACSDLNILGEEINDRPRVLRDIYFFSMRAMINCCYPFQQDAGPAVIEHIQELAEDIKKIADEGL